MYTPFEAFMSVEERRAIFVYEAARIESAMSGRPIYPPEWQQRSPEFRQNMVDAVKRQVDEPSGSPEELHNRWMRAYSEMGWKYGPTYSQGNKTHPDMLPFSRLPEKEQQKDRVFMALCQVAALIGP